MNTVVKGGRATAYFDCFAAKCNGPQGRPFCSMRFKLSEARALSGKLHECAAEPDRRRFILTWTDDDTLRIRLLLGVTPQFERDAAQNYVRGDAVHVTGRSSVNIEFSKGGARELADELEDAMHRAREFVELRVPNARKRRDLIEFWPDSEIMSDDVDEHAALGFAGAELAAQVLAREDFRDWKS